MKQETLEEHCTCADECLGYLTKTCKRIEEPKQELHSMDDEVECNSCGNIMSLIEDESIYACSNSECTRYYEEPDYTALLQPVGTRQECKGSFKDCFKPLDECICGNIFKNLIEKKTQITVILFILMVKILLNVN